MASDHVIPECLSSPESFRYQTVSVSKVRRSVLAFLVHSKAEVTFHSPYCPNYQGRLYLPKLEDTPPFPLMGLFDMFSFMDSLEWSCGHTAELFSSFDDRSDHVDSIVFG